MYAPWLHELESLEAISQDDAARRIFLHLAALSHTGRLTGFLTELAGDRDLDDSTKDHLIELAGDRSFLLALEEYLWRTSRVH